MKLIIKSEVLAQANGLKAGEVLEVDDRKGVPTDSYWRNRLRESAIDKCVEVQKKALKAKPAEEVKAS